MYQTAVGSVQVSVQTGQVSVHDRSLMPVRSAVSNCADFQTVFGSQPPPCALISQQKEREWLQIMTPQASFQVQAWTPLPLSSILRPEKMAGRFALQEVMYKRPRELEEYALPLQLDDNTVWYDSGIRVKISEISSLKLSSGYTGYERDQTSVFKPTNRLAQVKDQKLTYWDGPLGEALPKAGAGNIGTNKWLVVVEIGQNSGFPCVSGTNAAALSANTGSPGKRLVSGTAQASSFGGGATGKTAKISQANADTLLDTDKTFTVCYSKTGGTTNDAWQDTYIHFKI